MKRVLVIGDGILDVYRHCTFKKMCPDHPNVKAAIETHCTYHPGGALNVAANVASLSPETIVDVICVKDPIAILHLGKEVHRAVNISWARGRHIIRKERVLVDGEMQVRIDNKLTVEPDDSAAIHLSLNLYFKRHVPDVIILSDYGAGTVNPECLQTLLSHREKLLVDTKLTDLSVFQGTLLAKLNQAEHDAVCLTGDHTPERHFKYLITTMGARGASLRVHKQIDDGRSMTHTMGIPGYAVDAVDPCGCGDTFMAGLAASLLNSSDMFMAMRFANAAAATVVRTAGTSIAKLSDVELLLKETNV